VLAVLFGAPDRSFYANELIALAGSSIGAAQRKLAGLLAAGLVTVRDQGNQKHYQTNQRASPVFAELRGLVLKTVGRADVQEIGGNRGQIMISSKVPSPRRKGEAILDGSTEHLSCPESLTH